MKKFMLIIAITLVGSTLRFFEQSTYQPVLHKGSVSLEHRSATHIYEKP
jgi:hypothetical protein